MEKKKKSDILVIYPESNMSWYEYDNYSSYLTHYQTTNLWLFQAERVCRRQLQIWQNGRKLSKRVENTVGKGEIAHYEQFFLFPLCFQKACFPGTSKGVIVWEWVKDVKIIITISWAKKVKRNDRQVLRI